MATTIGSSVTSLTEVSLFKKTPWNRLGIDILPELRGTLRRSSGRLGGTDQPCQELAKSACRSDDRRGPASPCDYDVPGASWTSARRHRGRGHWFVEGTGFPRHQRTPQPSAHSRC